MYVLNPIPMIPGCDGLTTEYYQTFVCFISTELVDAFNYAFQTEKLTLTMHYGVIVLIWKGNIYIF